MCLLFYSRLPEYQFPYALNVVTNLWLCNVCLKKKNKCLNFALFCLYFCCDLNPRRKLHCFARDLPLFYFQFHWNWCLIPFKLVLVPILHLHPLIICILRYFGFILWMIGCLNISFGFFLFFFYCCLLRKHYNCIKFHKCSRRLEHTTIHEFQAFQEKGVFVHVC